MMPFIVLYYCTTLGLKHTLESWDFQSLVLARCSLWYRQWHSLFSVVVTIWCSMQLLSRHLVLEQLTGNQWQCEVGSPRSPGFGPESESPHWEGLPTELPTLKLLHPFIDQNSVIRYHKAVNPRFHSGWFLLPLPPGKCLGNEIFFSHVVVGDTRTLSIMLVSFLLHLCDAE